MFPAMDPHWIDALPADKREVLSRIESLHTALMEAAESGDWVRTAELERERATCLQALYANVQDLDPDTGECLARITEQLIRGDRALMNKVERERSRLGDELGHLRRGQKAVNAYTDHARR
ncbi:hypothetical protein J2T60_000394 [Natronospira proteinivora]|uniref:Flagellar protein FliT n=1 Tax=Natronospira proteinivora TaxID=1807133 RepID=A0ABT1G556_9GAMM|nr:flagellar protein FliT [Natronospira proteinivora]MCP1726429.1 hypothetical protein [Natronospira proteinivora]